MEKNSKFPQFQPSRQHQNRIIVPTGPPVETIRIDIDAKGTATLQAHMVSIGGAGQKAMPPLRTVQVLAAMVQTVLNGIATQEVALNATEASPAPDPGA